MESNYAKIKSDEAFLLKEIAVFSDLRNSDISLKKREVEYTEGIMTIDEQRRRDENIEFLSVVSTSRDSERELYRLDRIKDEKGRAEETYIFPTGYMKMRADEYLEALHDKDIAKFSGALAAQYAPVFEKRKVSDIEGLLREKFRGVGVYDQEVGYEYIPSVYREDSLFEKDGNFNHGSGCISFESLDRACNNEFTRAHENIHALTARNDGCGLLCVTHKNKIENKSVPIEQGRAINEGATNIIASRACGIPSGEEYEELTFLARQLEEIVGADEFFEGMLFDPNIVKHKFNSLAGDEMGYTRFVKATDKALQSLIKAHQVEEGSNKQEQLLDQAGDYLAGAQRLLVTPLLKDEQRLTRFLLKYLKEDMATRTLLSIAKEQGLDRNAFATFLGDKESNIEY